MYALNNVQGRELPFYLLEKLKATPSHTFRIVPETEIEYDDSDNPMPPESDFRQEFVSTIERQCKTKEQNKVFKTKDDLFNHFEAVWANR